jgi:GNAT superfamily N-acetyltransferase
LTTELLRRAKVKKTNFENILPFWQKLWPNTSTISDMSSIRYLGGYDVSIYKKYKPTFFNLYIDNRIAGVISGHKSDPESYRLRGIYIEKEYRGNSLSSILFKSIEKQAIVENCTNIWSFPRKESLFSYESAGYIRTTEFITQGIDYGPNCFVIKILNS